MIFACIRDHLVPEFTVRDCCRVLRVSTAGYYRWIKHPIGKRQTRREELAEKIRTPFILSEVASLFEAGAEIPSTRIGILEQVIRLQERERPANRTPHPGGGVPRRFHASGSHSPSLRTGVAGRLTSSCVR